MRETIETKEDLNNIYCEGKHSYFKCVNYETVYTDLGKAYEEIEMVVQKKSDEKFFKFEFKESEHHGLSDNNFPLEGKEVFPKTITKIIYE